VNASIAIQHGVVVAAGRGSRLGDLTRDTPKPLLEVGGTPLLLRILDGMSAAGVTDIAVITGYRGETVERAVRESGLPIRFEFRHQAELDGTARAVALARDVLGDGPFCFAWGDILVDRENYAAVVTAAAGADGSLAVNEVDDPWAGAAVDVDATGFVTRIVEKPPRGTSTTRFNNAGLGVLPPSVWRHIDEMQPSPRGEYELPQVMASLVGAGARLRAVPVAGAWWDIGTADDLAAARAHFG
jgi:dTDP-glucose pyrophosphorylase